MKRALFIVTLEYTGATTATRIYASEKAGEYQAVFASITPGPSSRKLISETIDNTTPDTIFCSFSTLNPEVILEGKERGLSVVVRSDYKMSDLQPATQRAIKRTYLLADKVLVQTEELKDELISFLGQEVTNVFVWKTKIDKQEIIAKAVETESPFPVNGKCHFLWVGRSAPIKDLSTLLKAFQLLREKNNEVELYLVGEMKEIFRAQGVVQVGFQDNPYPWIKNADCLVLTSKSEAQPNVIREALMLDTPVISSRSFIPSNDMASDIEWFEVGDYKALAQLMNNISCGNK